MILFQNGAGGLANKMIIWKEYISCVPALRQRSYLLQYTFPTISLFLIQRRELDKAARQMANEAVNVKDNVGGSTDMTGGVNANMSQAEAAESQGPLVSLGRTVFRGEKFFWRYVLLLVYNTCSVTLFSSSLFRLLAL